MNIDVKDALDNVITACNSLYNKIEDGNLLEKMLAQDIFNFIRNISNDNGKSKYEYFNKIYLHGNYCIEDIYNTENTNIPNLLIKFCDIDNKLKNSNVKFSELLINFFAVLGKSYLSNPADRKTICVSKIAEQINAMNEYKNHNCCLKQVEQKSEINYSSKVLNNDEKPVESKTIDKTTEVSNEPEETLDELLKKLNSLIGLNEVKKEVEQIINLIKVKKKGEEFGEKSATLSLHLVFFGNPGTGKTTVARLLAKIYKSFGVLSTGQLIEVDRSGLVGGYVGQTAIKTQEVIDKAMGGILFIDEAYTLTHGKGENDFGQEAVDTILKAMEDHRDDFIVIVAGYPDLMKEFVASNPGLKSRFNQYINFEDYKPNELKEIFNLLCKEQNFTLSEDCSDFLNNYFEEIYNNRSDDYANGRDVRNYFEKVVKARANRIAPILENITFEEFSTVSLTDLKYAEKINNKM